MPEYTFQAINLDCEPFYENSLLNQVLRKIGTPLQDLALAEAEFVEVCEYLGFTPRTQTPQGEILRVGGYTRWRRTVRWFVMLSDERGPSLALFRFSGDAQPGMSFWARGSGLNWVTKENRPAVRDQIRTSLQALGLERLGRPRRLPAFTYEDDFQF